ncbi:WAS/WASL-interacting protein family member 2-like [Carassius gibelio]|uniref:WAS/WASL-interacting protein family member 2-like n=1 Tax=Carassius gibelio TaxID=101364 RepID=UPI002278DAFD|nr:WAS/WASL-interacting protein family member 2-like [Carassius gibelio]
MKDTNKWITHWYLALQPFKWFCEVCSGRENQETCVHTSSKPAARRRPRRRAGEAARPGPPPGGGGHRDGGPDAGRSWGDPREGPGACPESPPHTATHPPRRPRPDAGAADTPRRTAPDAPRRPGAAPPAPPPEGGTGRHGRTGRNARGGDGGAWRRMPEAGTGRGDAGRPLPQPRRGPSPASHLSPTDPALRANPYPEVTDLTCRLPLRRLVLTRQRLFTLETCCGYGYGPARDLHLLPRIFKGRQELTEPRGFPGRGPLSRDEPIPGCPALHKEKRTLPRAPASFSGFVCVTALGASRHPSPPLRVLGSEPDSLSIGRGRRRPSPLPSERRSPIP